MSASHDGMVRLPGGTFRMGSARFYPEERPMRLAQVDAFWIDTVPVTNAAFSRFVQATGHVTTAERRLDDGLPNGSAVFMPAAAPVDLRDPSQWWQLQREACWHRPRGAGSSLEGQDHHPVVHVSAEDAQAYASWAGKQLPTEAQWEYAARGGLEGAEYAWGNALAPDGLMLANYWQGPFPVHNTLADGWLFTSPVDAFPANGYGLHDMIGNVWEWTADAWTTSGDEALVRRCCTAPTNAAVRSRVLKGGSHLCAVNYCQRYRPAARHSQSALESTGHIGFRCVRQAA